MSQEVNEERDHNGCLVGLAGEQSGFSEDPG